jgi:hypothetical protein
VERASGEDNKTSGGMGRMLNINYRQERKYYRHVKRNSRKGKIITAFIYTTTNVSTTLSVPLYKTIISLHDLCQQS